MNEAELRALVRDAIARHTQAQAPTMSGLAGLDRARQHASHAMFILPTGSDAGGPCVIEPAVMCSHCGYCKSFGH